jgi:hypothetical protein
MDINNLWDCRYVNSEFALPTFAMPPRFDHHENRQIKPDKFGIQTRSIAFDHSQFVQPLYPPPARILRQTYLRCDVPL